MRLIDCRTSLSTSVNDSTANAGAIPGRVLELGPEPVVGHELHPAVGVVDQDDLVGAESPLRDRERADHVIGDHSAGVSKHVRLAPLQPERREDVEPGIHARDDREPQRRLDVEVPGLEARHKPPVVLEQLVGHPLAFRIGHRRPLTTLDGNNP